MIFKKYSPVGELSLFAAQMCDTLSKTTGCACAVTDRDTVIAVSGLPKREVLDKRISEDLERIIESRLMYQMKSGERKLQALSDSAGYFVSVAAPILAEGDVSGSVVFLTSDASPMGETEYKLAQTVAGFLGKQMES